MSVEVAEACGAWEVAPIVDSQNIEKIYPKWSMSGMFIHILAYRFVVNENE